MWMRVLLRLRVFNCADTSQAYLPEPLYNRVVGAVAVFVNSVLSPVINVDITQTTHQQLHSKGQQKKKCYGLIKLKRFHGHRYDWRTEVIPPVHFHQRSWLGLWGWAQWSPENQTEREFNNNWDGRLINRTFFFKFRPKNCFLLGLYRPQVVTITTSKKAFICFWTRLTNLHWITRLPEERDNSNKRANFKTKSLFFFFK